MLDHHQDVEAAEEDDVDVGEVDGEDRLSLPVRNCCQVDPDRCGVGSKVRRRVDLGGAQRAVPAGRQGVGDRVQDQGKALPWLLDRTGAELAAEQEQAVRLALTQRVAVLTGGPGFGKSFTVKAIITLAAAKRAKIVLAAPTGRAAKRLTELFGHPGPLPCTGCCSCARAGTQLRPGPSARPRPDRGRRGQHARPHPRQQADQGRPGRAHLLLVGESNRPSYQCFTHSCRSHAGRRPDRRSGWKGSVIPKGRGHGREAPHERRRSHTDALPWLPANASAGMLGSGISRLHQVMRQATLRRCST
jgi:AAA domain